MLMAYSNTLKVLLFNGHAAKYVVMVVVVVDGEELPKIFSSFRGRCQNFTAP